MHCDTPAGAGWHHVYGDVTPEAGLTPSGGDELTVQSMPLTRDALTMQAGIDAGIDDNLSLGVAHADDFGDHTSDRHTTRSRGTGGHRRHAATIT